MIARQIVDIYPVGHHSYQGSDHMHVGIGPVILLEIPHVDKITIPNNSLWINGIKILNEFNCMATYGTEMDIR